MPASADEAVAAFGDGDGVTVVGGGTIVMPELTPAACGRRGAPARARRARRHRARGRHGDDRRHDARLRARGRRRAARDRGRATSPTSRSARRRPSAATSARRRADAPRGDLQAPLLALGARVRSAGAGGERTEPVEDFLADGARPARARRLLRRRAAADRVRRGLAAARPPLHDPRGRGRRAATARCASPRPAPARSGASRARAPSDAAAPTTSSRRDDALASAWYRAQVLPELVERALADLEEAR